MTLPFNLISQLANDLWAQSPILSSKRVSTLGSTQIAQLNLESKNFQILGHEYISRPPPPSPHPCPHSWQPNQDLSLRFS